MITSTTEELQHLSNEEIQQHINDARAVLNDPTTDWDGMDQATTLMNIQAGRHIRVNSKQLYLDAIATLEQQRLEMPTM